MESMTMVVEEGFSLEVSNALISLSSTSAAVHVGCAEGFSNGEDANDERKSRRTCIGGEGCGDENEHACSMSLLLPQNCDEPGAAMGSPNSHEALDRSRSSIASKEDIYLDEKGSPQSTKALSSNLTSIVNDERGRASSPLSASILVDTSGTSIESIGKISDLDLLSPIPQRAFQQIQDLGDLRLSIGSFGGSPAKPSPTAGRKEEEDVEMNSNSDMQASIEECDLPSSAKRVFLRLEQGNDPEPPPAEEDFFPTYQPRFSLLFTTIDEEVENDGESDDNDEDSQVRVEEETKAVLSPSEGFTGKRGNLAKLSPTPTSLCLIAEGNDEPYDEVFADSTNPFDWGKSQDLRLVSLDEGKKLISGATVFSLPNNDEQPSVNENTLTEVNKNLLNRAASQSCDQGGGECSHNLLADDVVDTERARSMTLIQRLHAAAFRRKMNITTSLDSASLSWLDDEVQAKPAYAAIQGDAVVSSSERSLQVGSDLRSVGSVLLPSNPVHFDSYMNNSLLIDQAQASSIVTMGIAACAKPLDVEAREIEPFTEIDISTTSHTGDAQEAANLSRPESTLSAATSIVMQRGSLDDEASLLADSSDSYKDEHGEDEGKRSSPDQKDHEESAVSFASLRSNNILKTAGELGASSMAFIQQLRGAAFRRKMHLARSRDSLAAKERKQREDVAASKADRLEREDLEQQAAVQRRKPLPMEHSIMRETFKARPLPETTGLKGSGGLTGVPKVEKKPTTAPISPYLGPRRHLRDRLNPDSEDSHQRPSLRGDPMDPSAATFKALPLPKSTGQFGAAGQAGVPKVQKRQVTVAHSPLLGVRRIQKEAPSQISTLPKLDLAARSMFRPSNGSHFSGSSHSLIGADLCSLKENDEAVATPRNVVFPEAFIPHSTDRAKKRADFEAQRLQNELMQKEEERRDREQLVKVLRKDLSKLRMSI